MTPVELKAFRVGLFATSETINQALDYAYMVAKASDNPPVVIAAVHIVLNTVIKELNKYAVDIH